MSFVPVSGPATFRPAAPPRDGVVEFTDDRRTVALPIRAALPVLTRAQARGEAHPSVALLAGAALLGMRVVAAGAFEPASDVPAWRPTLGRADLDRLERLAASHADPVRDPVHDPDVGLGLDREAAAELARAVLEAVVDALPRTSPAPLAAAPAAARTPPRPTREEFRARLQARLERHRQEPPDARPQLVAIALRVEADEEDLLAGSVRLVLQVADEQDPLRVCDAALLWAESGPDAAHGFGDRARTHATIALRGAAHAWPVLDRMLQLRVPDQITLEADEISDLLEHGVGALRERGVDVLWPRALGRDLTAAAVLDVAPSPAPSPGGAPRDGALQDAVLSPDAVFAFRWQVSLDGDPLTEEEMEQLARAAAPVLRLRGAWTVVDPAVARKARRRLARRVAAGEALAATLTGAARLSAAGEQEEQVIVGATLLKVRQRLLEAPEREPVASPDRLQATLRDYQRQGLTWLAEMTDLGLGACLADDMGLGKTVTLIALHLHRAAQAAPGTARPTLVVCPASLLGNWQAEIERFAPGTPVRRFHGTERSLTGLGGSPGTADADLLDGLGTAEDPGFVLTTYGTMRVSQEPLAAVPWGLVVADEAQHVKNPRSATARALRAIPSSARVALTGTPVENDLTELWAILDWAVPGLLGSRNAFRKVWAAPIESGLEPTKARQFADLVRPFLLRRRKSDPGIAPELPAKTETDHLLGLTREQVVLYEAFVRDTMDRIERADEDSRRGLVLSLLTGLKQICNHPAQFLRQSGAVRLTGRSEKLELLDELLATVLAEGGAALVFTQYVAMARLVETHLARTGVPHQLLHGGTPVREREAMVRRFQDPAADGAVPVFLLSLKAGGTGLNLTRADHVVHLDRWWNPAVEEQATDRAYRIGQTKPVQVHRMITRGTLEERIALLLARKRALAESVLGRGDAALTELTNAELRDLVVLRRDGGA